MSVPYRDLPELVLNARKDQDYALRIIDLGAHLTITAVHGGGIDPLTSELAQAIAGGEYNLYDFRGVRATGNDELRVPVARFDEMRLRELMGRSHTAVSIQGIQGIRGSGLTVHVGGGNRRLKRGLAERLEKAGFEVKGPAGPRPAHDPSRFYNRPTAGGVQVEMTRALRESMIDCPLCDFLWEGPSHWNDRFKAFVDGARAALERYHAEVRADLNMIIERFEDATATFPTWLRNGKHHRQE